MKKKLLLETVLKIKADVERSIENTYDDIIKYNMSEKKVDNLLERAEKLEIQLIHLKEVIQEANKGKFEGKTNFFNIFHLSNLNAKREFYRELEKRLTRASKKASVAQIGINAVTSKLKLLGEEINKFQKKLTTYNSKKKVTVYLDESLNLL